MTADEIERQVDRFFDPGHGPDPVICPYCGRELRREAVTDGDGGFAYWDPRDPECGCEASRLAEDRRRRAEDAAMEAERRRQRDMEFSSRARACLAPGCMRRLFGDRTFETFCPGSDQMAMARRIVESYADRFESMERTGTGMYIWGPYGTGKTHLAMALRHRLHAAGVRRVLARTVTEMLADVRACYQPGGGDEADVLGLYKSARLLILDDLGKEKPTSWGMNTTHEILNARYIAKLPTVVTSNFAVGELADVMAVGGSTDKAGAIADRFRECMIDVPMDGPSHRARNAS